MTNKVGLNTLLRASTSFSMKKLQAIIKSLRDNADQIAKLALIIEGQYASRARLEAGQERGENQKERDEGSAWRKQMQSDRVRSWLGGDMVNESNLRRHANNLNICKPGSTCDWLSDDYCFRKWVDEPSANPMIWLCAGPGAGKSVLCSMLPITYKDRKVQRQLLSISMNLTTSGQPCLQLRS